MVEAVSWCRGEHCSPVSFPTQLRDKTKLCRSQNGTSRAPSPTHLCLQFVRRKIALLFAVFTLYMDIEKRCRDFFSDTALLFHLLLCAFISLSAPLGRLSPNEALPHTPQGTLSLDPASPLTPGLILRFISRYARCWEHNSGQLCSFLIPHSSFLIPHLLRHCLFHFLYKLPEHRKRFINRLSCCHIYSCTLKQ